MRLRRTAFVSFIAILLMSCTSCSVEQLDPDDDGFVSGDELWAAAADFLCDNDSSNERPDDETPDDETPDDETPTDETPTGGSLDQGTNSGQTIRTRF